MVNASTWVGAALGLAIFSAISTSHTRDVLAAGGSLDHALTAGFGRALLACSIFLVGAALIALRATNAGQATVGVGEVVDVAAVP